MNKIFVCQIDELDEGEALKVDCNVGEIEALAVFNNGGEFFAMNDRCSHGNASMSEGMRQELVHFEQEQQLLQPEQNSQHLS